MNWLPFLNTEQFCSQKLEIEKQTKPTFVLNSFKSWKKVGLIFSISKTF